MDGSDWISSHAIIDGNFNIITEDYHSSEVKQKILIFISIIIS